MNSQLIQFNRLKNKSGKNVEVVKSDFSKIETICIVKEFDNGNNSTEDKTIFFSIEDNIQQGDIIQYENNTYIILLQEENINNVYCKYVARRCDHTMKIYIDSKLYEIPCIIESSNNGVVEGKFIIIGDGNLKLTTQDNNITNKIKEDMRIIKWGYAWKVIAKSCENKGLTYIYFEKDATNSATDDVENEIADRWTNEVKHTYNIIINEENISIEKGKTKQLNITVTDTVDSETNTIENPTLIYTSNDNSVVTVENGLINAIEEGDAIITIKYENIEKVINIKVSKVEIIPKDYYKVEISNTNCPPYIKWGRQAECTVNYYKDNIAQSNTFEFSVTDINNATTTLATIISKENNECVIEANANRNSGQIVLHCKDTTNSNTIDRTIEIQSLFAGTTRTIQSILINKDVTTVGTGENLQLTVNAKNETFEYKEPNIFFLSDNENIATVDATGKITGVGEGTCNITVYTLDKKFSDTIQINVVKNVVLEIIGKDNMAIGRTRTYTSNIPATWSIKDVDNTTSTAWASITSQTDTTCTVKTTDAWIFDDDGKSKYFMLTATDKNNNSNIVEKKIKITSY